MKNIIIDLHMHTTNSDGSKTTREIIEELKSKGAKIMSITDHDTVKSYYDIKENQDIVKDIVIVPGVEMTCNYNGSTRDFLCYGMDIDKMNNFLTKNNNKNYKIKKEEKLLEQFKKKCKNYGFYFDDDIKIVNGDKAESFTVMYNNLIKYNKNFDVCNELDDINGFYWHYYANINSKLFIDQAYDMPTIKQVCEVIHKLNGLVFLAHPYCYNMSDEETDKFIYAGISAGIDGIEVEHSSHNEYQKKRVEDIAKKNNLYMSGGSDYHGTRKPKIKSVTGTNNNVSVKYKNICEWVLKIDNIINRDMLINLDKNYNK